MIYSFTKFFTTPQNIFLSCTNLNKEYPPKSVPTLLFMSFYCNKIPLQNYNDSNFITTSKFIS